MRVVAREFAALQLMVGIAAEDVAFGGDGDTATVGHHLQAMPRQFQVAEDLGAQQAADVGAV